MNPTLPPNLQQKKRKKPRPTIFQSSGWLHITLSSKTTSPFLLIIYRPPPPNRNIPSSNSCRTSKKKKYIYSSDPTRSDPIPELRAPNHIPWCKVPPSSNFFFLLRPHALTPSRVRQKKERKKRKKPALFTRPPQHSSFGAGWFYFCAMQDRKSVV